MGTCCVERATVEHNYESIVSSNSSFIASESSYDEKFVWFHPLPELNILMRSLLQHPRQCTEPELIRLDSCLEQLGGELNSLERPDSDTSRKLERIETMLEQPDWGYLLFELQRIELVREKNKTMTLTLQGTDATQVCSKQVLVKNYKAEPNVLVEWVLKEKGKIKLQLGECYSTIDLNEVQNRLLVVEALNIKARGVLDPIGKALVRVQYIQNLNTFRKVYSAQLRFKQEQLRALLTALRSGVTTQPTDILILSVMGGPDPAESKLRQSFYQNEFQM